MSVQFGKCNFDGQPVDPKELDEVRPVLAPYGPDGEGYIAENNFGLLYRAFHTTRESRRETQPKITQSGSIICWDGRLDNREQFIERLRGELSDDLSDAGIVAAAYDRWGVDVFRDLIGDWALSIWNANDQSLVLAKDFIGTRHLYYSFDGRRATWCTILDPLVLFGSQRLSLSKEYIAGWLSSFPCTHLTPYREIRSVPPSHFVRLQTGSKKVNKYWEFDSRKRIDYLSDREYEEHFRTVFAEAVRRRLRSDTAALAGLSGGMDSSSIVSMADKIICRGQAEIPRLDTLSYYDSNEPNWDEHLYFGKVEEQRGRRGLQVDLSSRDFFSLDLGERRFCATPGALLAALDKADSGWDELNAGAYRVRLSGIGGDELAGGVPDPAPQLADLAVAGQFTEFFRQSAAWAIASKQTWFRVASNTLAHFLPEILPPRTTIARVPWLRPAFVKRHSAALRGYPRRTQVLGAMPSFQMAIETLDCLRRQLACSVPTSMPLYEERYPFLDRSLIELLFAIPRRQIAVPGRRRFLMRRAMKGLVPDDILTRRRKASVSRAPLVAITKYANSLRGLFRNGLASSLAIVDERAIHAALQDASQGRQIAVVSLLRVVALELWLRQLPTRVEVGVKEISAEKSLKKGGELDDLQQAGNFGSPSCSLGYPGHQRQRSAY